VLPVLFWSGMLVATGSMALTWSLPGRGARIASSATICAACAVAQLIVSPRIDRIRATVSGPMDALAVNDPQRLAFGRLHGVSVGLLALSAMAGFVGLVLLSRILLLTRDA
jgi:hypothetical protein